MGGCSVVVMGKIVKCSENEGEDNDSVEVSFVIRIKNRNRKD